MCLGLASIESIFDLLPILMTFARLSFFAMLLANNIVHAGQDGDNLSVKMMVLGLATFTVYPR